ncbi:hypothetical protein SAMN03080601_01557 [Alkalitalea saponilacus]|uniref:Uncharacterized protein n=1 Tax=Alkalitalea saponilacus TaxID=889453 RepID=A0A1T5F9U7_9BACT|nr:hypothetical protein SAMN03080601_01557 [Alkalitalea saponilacus]
MSREKFNDLLYYGQELIYMKSLLLAGSLFYSNLQIKEIKCYDKLLSQKYFNFKFVFLKYSHKLANNFESVIKTLRIAPKNTRNESSDNYYKTKSPN